MKKYLDHYWHKAKLLEIKKIDDDTIYFEVPEKYWVRNTFSFLEDDKKNKKLYIEFANLLTPDSKKQNFNKLEKMREFFSKYGYIYDIKLNKKLKKKNEDGTVTFSDNHITKHEGKVKDVEKEIRLLNVILRLENILNVGLKINDTIPILEDIAEAFLRVINYYQDINMDNSSVMVHDINLWHIGVVPYEIKTEENLKFANRILKQYISGLIDSVIRKIEPRTIFVDNKPTFGFYCNSLLEVMYLQLFEDLENSKMVVSYCNFCGKIIFDNKFRKYCLMTEEDKDNFRTKSRCASNGGMQEKRKREKEQKTGGNQ